MKIGQKKALGKNLILNTYTFYEVRYVVKKASQEDEQQDENDMMKGQKIRRKSLTSLNKLGIEMLPNTQTVSLHLITFRLIRAHTLL